MPAPDEISTPGSFEWVKGLARIHKRRDSRRPSCSFVLMRALKPLGVIGTLDDCCSAIVDQRLRINLAWLALQLKKFLLNVVCYEEILELFVWLTWIRVTF
jgi:hypothetical protein